MSYYRLSQARITGEQDFALRRKGRYVHYHLGKGKALVDPALKPIIAAIDQAYAMDGDQCVRTRIQRDHWPIREISCEDFSTNFFKTANFLGAFEVNEVIDYEWLPAQVVA